MLMDTSTRRPLATALAGVALCLVLVPVPGAAQATAPAAALRVVFHADRMAFEGRDYGDSAALLAALAPRKPRSLQLDACMPGAAAALTTAAYRLREFALQLRTLDPQHADCRSDAPRAIAVSLSPAAAAASADLEAVRAYWRSIEP